MDDASFHAVDKIEPGSVEISPGQTVDFYVDGFHQVAIYAVGTKPKDIVPAGDFVNDGEFALGGLTANFSHTFTQPGKYLVICNITPHFEFANMWGWVIVE